MLTGSCYHQSVIFIVVILITHLSDCFQAPKLDFSFGKVHFRRFGTLGLRTVLENPFRTDSTANTTSLAYDVITPLPRPQKSRDSVHTVAIEWLPNTPMFISLDVYVTVFNSKTRLYSTSKISLQIQNDELSYSIERKFLEQFSIDCDEPDSGEFYKSDLFVHQCYIPSNGKYITFGLHDWASFPRNRLFYPPVMLTYRGKAFTSFPLADGVATKCRINAVKNGAFNHLTVEISGDFELSSKTGVRPQVYAHADSLGDVSSYYAKVKSDKRCDEDCVPVYFDGQTIFNGNGVASSANLSEFSCRPDSEQGIYEWWKCSNFGRQSIATSKGGQGIEVKINPPSGIPKYNVTAALGDYLVYCSAERFRDTRALKWKWYNERTRAFDEFPLQGWRGSDTSCLWFTAALQSSVSYRAYQCIESETGKPVKEIFFEYNNAVIYTQSCRFQINRGQNAQFESHQRSPQRPSVLSVTPGIPLHARISCQVQTKLYYDESDENATSAYSVVKWDKTEATSFPPEFILQAKYTKESDQFHLNIETDFQTDESLDRYNGMYTLVLHYENEVSQLVLQFRIKRAVLGVEEPTNSSQFPYSQSATFLLTFLSVIILFYFLDSF